MKNIVDCKIDAAVIRNEVDCEIEAGFLFIDNGVYIWHSIKMYLFSFEFFAINKIKGLGKKCIFCSSCQLFPLLKSGCQDIQTFL